MELVFATHNKNKLKEIQALLPAEIKLLSLADIGCIEDIPETSPTIEGNAVQKANYIRKRYGVNVFADDTGLEVDELDGAPGVYSARYAGEAKNDRANVEKLLQELQGKNNRIARFKTVIALNLNGTENTFTGICRGNIALQPSGDKGFGYDPVFIPEGFSKSFAEMELRQKSEISHRGKAIKQLISYLSK